MSDISTRERILDAGEKRARIGGYHGFSFRDLSNDVGIKSASIHYHFPTKTDLVEAITARYIEKTKMFLKKPKDEIDALEQVISLFRDALTISDKMCLCGLLGAERDTLPDRVVQQTGEYFQLLIDYLNSAMTGKDSVQRAQSIVASLEGALIVARNLKDDVIFESIVTDMKKRAV